MNIPTSLIAKGMAGVAAVAASVGVATNWDKISGLFGSTSTALDETEIIAKVGLSCGTNNECTLKAGEKIKIKQGDNTSDEINSLTTSPGKIKLYKNESTYANKLKFVIEGGDIALNGDSVTKLEEFSTYEIKKHSDEKWYLSRKTKAIDEKSKILGLTSLGDNCKLPENNNEVVCEDLDATKLKAINFEGKNSSQDPTVNAASKPKLKISQTSDSDLYTNGYKFIFESAGDASIPASPSEISLRANTNTEFKIKKVEKNLTLERVWNENRLGEKVGLSCSGDECSFQSGKTMNVMETGKKTKGVNALTLNSGAKIKLYKDVAEYNQGFKFTIEVGNASLTGGTLSEGSSVISQLEQNSNYEIKFVGSDWYFSKKP